jgi:ribonuclease Z
MQVHCLGTTGYHPSPKRHTACYYLPQAELVLDAGTGLFRLIPLLLKDPKRHLTILLSHAHLDHIVGLTFLIDLFAVTQLKGVTVIGEREKLEAIGEHLYSEHIFPVTPNFEFQALDGCSGSLQLAGATVRYFPLQHPGGSVGYVIEAGGRRIAYVTDTVADVQADYVAELRRLDLLMHECYFDDQRETLAMKTGHSWLSAVVELARQVKAPKTALIHINPLAEILGLEIELTDEQKAAGILVAEDEMVISVDEPFS